MLVKIVEKEIRKLGMEVTQLNEEITDHHQRMKLKVKQRDEKFELMESLRREINEFKKSL